MCRIMEGIGKIIALIKALGGGGGGGTQKQSDWNQNDATQLDYIKGRPGGYDEEGFTVIVPDTTVAFNSGIGQIEVPASYTPAEGDALTVTFDSTAYPLTYVLLPNGFLACGNLSIPGAGADTGEPFVIVKNGNFLLISTNQPGDTHTIKIEAVALTAVPFGERYIPDNLPPRCIPTQAFPVIIEKQDLRDSTAEIWQSWFNKFCSGVRFVLRENSRPNAETYTVLSIFYSDTVGGQIAYITPVGTLHVGAWDSKSGYTEKAVDLISTLIPRTADNGKVLTAEHNPDTDKNKSVWKPLP